MAAHTSHRQFEISQGDPVKVLVPGFFQDALGRPPEFVTVQLVPRRLVNEPFSSLAELDERLRTPVDLVEVPQGNASVCTLLAPSYV